MKAVNCIYPERRNRQKRTLRRANIGAILRAHVNRGHAIEMRLKGFSYRRIAGALGVSVSTAYGYVDYLLTKDTRCGGRPA